MAVQESKDPRVGEPHEGAGADQRALARAAAPVLARVRGDKGRYIEVTDITCRGMRVRTSVPLRQGQWVPVRIYFPDLPEEIEVTGRVAWRQDDEVGLDYTGLDDDDAGLLDVMIRHQRLFDEGGVRMEIPRA